MSLPSPALSVPTLAVDQAYFNGVTFGAFTPFEWTKVEGIGKPKIRSGNTARPRTRGSFVGLNLLDTRTLTFTLDIGPISTSLPQLTNLIPDPSFAFDTLGSAPSSTLWAQTTSGSITANTFAVSNAWAQTGSQSLHIQGTHSNDSTSESIGAQTPSNTIPATAGITYTLEATCNVAQGGPGAGIVFSLAWYTSGNSLISTSTSSVLSAGQIGVLSNSFTATAPATTAFVQVTITIQTVAANQIVEYYLDAVALAATAGAFTYFDGGTLGYKWSGTAGASSSIPQSGWGSFGPYGSNLAGALSAMRSACSTEGTTEYPLWIQLPNWPLVACMARVIGFDPPYDFEADLGGLGTGLMKAVPLQFEATDSYVYSAPTKSTSISLPTPGSGLVFPLAFPLSFGGGSSPNMATVTNAGDVQCWPELVITGPCSNPTVQNLSIAGNPSININLILNAGDTLAIDCDMQSIIYTPSGQTVGAPYPQVLNSGSTFWPLNPGNNVIAFNSSDSSPAAGTVAVWSASAYDGLT